MKTDSNIFARSNKSNYPLILSYTIIVYYSMFLLLSGQSQPFHEMRGEP